MYHTNDPLEQDILNLFEDDKIRVNAMRRFFKETVCDYLNDEPDNPEHEEAAYRFFDKWYRSLRKTIWTNGAAYTLEHHGTPPEEAKKEAITTYGKAYRKHDQKHRKGNLR